MTNLRGEKINKIVTENIAALGGSMSYKGELNYDQSVPESMLLPINDHEEIHKECDQYRIANGQKPLGEGGIIKQQITEPEKKQTTQQWFAKLLQGFENDPDFQKEGIIFELQERIAELEKQLEDLMCCGNCTFYESGCICVKHNFCSFEPAEYCDQWQTDTLARKDRIGK